MRLSSKNRTYPPRIAKQIATPGRKHTIHRQSLSSVSSRDRSASSSAPSYLSEIATVDTALDVLRDTASDHHTYGQCADDQQDVVDDSPVRPYVAMWRAVIMQAVVDARSESSKAEMAYEKQQAKVWLEGRNADFYWVCWMAEMDPQYVRERAAYALSHDLDLSHF